MNLLTFSKWLLFTSIVSGQTDPRAFDRDLPTHPPTASGRSASGSLLALYTGPTAAHRSPCGISHVVPDCSGGFDCLLGSICSVISVNHKRAMNQRMREPWYGSQFERINGNTSIGFFVRSYERNCSVHNDNIVCSFWIPAQNKILSLDVAVDSTNCTDSSLTTFSHGSLKPVYYHIHPWPFSHTNTRLFDIHCNDQPQRAKLFVREYICC